MRFVLAIATKSSFGTSGFEWRTSSSHRSTPAPSGFAFASTLSIPAIIAAAIRRALQPPRPRGLGPLIAVWPEHTEINRTTSRTIWLHHVTNFLHAGEGVPGRHCTSRGFPDRIGTRAQNAKRIAAGLRATMGVPDVPFWWVTVSCSGPLVNS